jgi:hypothetical protein
MATLNEYLGGLFGSISEARVMADAQSAQVAEQYAKHDLLRHFSIPRLRIGDIELTIPVAIQGLSERRGLQLSPIGNAEFKRALGRELPRYIGYTTLPPVAEQRLLAALDRRIPTLVEEIAAQGNVVEPMYRFAEGIVKDLYAIREESTLQEVAFAEKALQESVSVKALPFDEALRRCQELGIGLVGGVVEKPEIEQLTVIAESEQLRNQRPEDIIRIRMRVSEDGMEWQTLQRDDGTIERKLVSE